MGESPDSWCDLTPASAREQRARVWQHTRKALKAARVPPDQEDSLARAARRDVRLTRATGYRTQDYPTYHSKTYPGLVLLRDHTGQWGWVSKDWSDRGHVGRVGGYRTQRAALAAWAAATLEADA